MKTGHVLKQRESIQDKLYFYRECSNICIYCDGFGVSYATTFQIHGTSDMNVVTQRSGTKVDTRSIILTAKNS
jgi:uncharacterized Fe-S radical SAM superfamily protein PflX